MPTLHVLQGPDRGRTYHTADEAALIGRQSDHIQLADHSASRHHAEIKPDDGSWVLTDLNSSNGTFLNGQRVVAPTALKHGDQIKVGSTLMVFTGEDEAGGFASGPMIRDLVDLDISSAPGGSSILAAIDGSEESVILQPPETADAIAAWNVVYKIAEMIGDVEAIHVFLERVAGVIFDHLIADHLVLLMYGPDGVSLEPEAVRFRVKGRQHRPKITTSSTIVDHVIETKQGVLCANAMTDARFSSENLQDSIHQLGLRSVICVPIVAHDKVHGVIHLDCSMSHHTYTQEQLRLAVAIGRLTGMAIENAGLLETRMKTARLAATGETVAYLSHHIRNILQGMQGGADVVELGLKKQQFDTTLSGWELMQRNLERIYELTLNMLTFSKDRQPRIQSVQLNKTVQDVVALVQKRADEAGTMLLTELEEIPPVPCDPDGMHQVIHNIVLNAIDVVARQGDRQAAGGRVNVQTRYHPTDGIVTVAVSDNGPGIEQENISGIFDPFRSNKGQGGTGLGLAAAKKIVDELKGTIEVESTVGEGSTFHIHIPADHVRLADSDKTHGPPR